MVRSPTSADSDVRSKKHKKHKKQSHRDRDSSQDDERHQSSSKRTHRKDYDEPHKKRHKKDYRHDEKRQSSSPKRSPSRRSEKHSNSRKQVDDTHSMKPPSNIRIKREEDFDNRQEELRKARRDNHPNANTERRRNDHRRREERQHRDESGITHQAFQVKQEKPEEKEDEVEKEKPNLGLSGALTEDTNTYKGVVIKYNEPPEARQPKRRWRLYPFKGTESLKILHLHRQSAYLLGRQRRIADIPIDHPSCSKQHAVLQFRCVVKKVDGVTKKMVRPYVIDLGSGNGTYLNNAKIDPQRYYELKEQDVLKFGFSSREYVLLHAKSDTSEVDIGEEDDDIASDED